LNKLYFCAKFKIQMENTKDTTRKDWTIFAISTLVMIGILFVKPEWFWVVLPFSCTYLIKALNYM
jgi:hypothetical protein